MASGDLRPDDLCPWCLEPVDDCICDDEGDELISEISPPEPSPDDIVTLNNLGYLGVDT